MRFPDSRILIFAKAPQPGLVKTRLIPPLTPAEAARLHGELLAATLARVSSARLAPVELWCAPDPAFPDFTELADRYGLSLHRQSAGDLGERMHHAARDGLTRARRLLLLGADCPPMDGGYVAEALQAMIGGHDAVIGPAEDGGYVLFGLQRAEASLFAEMPWGTNGVAGLTRERMARLGWRWAELPTLWDLDRPQDLARYRALRSAAESVGGRSVR